jgi:hypothetical protein
MGRAMIILVLLMSTLFVAVAVRVQRDMAKLPETLLEEQLLKESEDISDYVLRYATLFAKNNIFDKHKFKTWEELLKIYGENLAVTLIFDSTEDEGWSSDYGFGKFSYGCPDFHLTGPNYGAEVRVKQIRFSHLGDTWEELSFLAESVVEARLQGEEVTYYSEDTGTISPGFPAEIAFNYSLFNKPNCFFYEGEQPQINHGHDEIVSDTSGSNNHGYATKGVATSPSGFDWKCLYFPGPGGVNDNGAFYVPDNPNLSMRVQDQFTLVLFAQIEGHHTTADGSLVWLPSCAPEPYDIPSIGIWYDSETGNMNFELGVDMDSEPIESLTIPYYYEPYLLDKLTPGQNQYPLTFLALTFGPRPTEGYSLATVYFKRFYVDKKGNLIPPNEYQNVDDFIENSISLNTSDVGFEDLVNIVETTNGASIGGRLTKLKGDASDGFKNTTYDRYLKGLMENIGMYDWELTEEEIETFFWSMMLDSTITYLRD